MHPTPTAATGGLRQFWAEFTGLDQDPEYFVTARLMEGRPAVWTSSIDYVRWRHEVARELLVDPLSVQVVGSARLGYSLNPKKDFKVFDSSSDMDIAVVSSELFETAWTEIRQLLDGSTEFESRKSYLRKLVFDECIALDVLLPHISFGAGWSKSRDSIVRLLGPDFSHLLINYRLYRTHAALRRYQLIGVGTARDRAIEEGLSDVS